ncbi:hypothetical protein WR25_06280 [Diploscapter pachys]|uniref:Uncharacterized protein n=1 Tax=Diploscapter pachys TaxID=2018661 RepID=A0A2A2LRG6_9BILA|nr:hypothetical protein WR25_06280 [Diploscapter pachys]
MQILTSVRNVEQSGTQGASLEQVRQQGATQSGRTGRDQRRYMGYGRGRRANANGRTVELVLRDMRNTRRSGKSRSENRQAVRALVTGFLRSTGNMKSRYEPEWTDAKISDIVKKAKKKTTLMAELAEHGADGRTCEQMLKEMRAQRQLFIEDENELMNMEVEEVTPSTPKQGRKNIELSTPVSSSKKRPGSSLGNSNSVATEFATSFINSFRADENSECQDYSKWRGTGVRRFD